MPHIAAIDLGGDNSIRIEKEFWRFCLHGDAAPVTLVMPTVDVGGRAVSLDRAAAVERSGDPVRRTRVSLDTPEVPGLVATLEVWSHAIHPGVRLRVLLEARAPIALRATPGQGQFFRVILPSEVDLEEQRIGDFDPGSHSYRPLRRSVRSRGGSSVRLVGPLVRLQRAGDELVVAHEGPVEAETAFWSYRFDRGRGALDIVAEVGAVLDSQDLFTQPWESETFHLVSAPHDAWLAYRRFFGAVAAPAGEHDLSYNTWHRQEQSHYVEGVPYLARINQTDLAEEMAEAASVGVKSFTIDVGWFERSGDWDAHPERLPGGIRSWADRAKSHGMTLGLWMNPMVAALGSASIQEFATCRMSFDGRELDPHPIWETESSAPMCLASDWAHHIEEQLRRLAAAGVRKVKFDGLWPASFEWAGKPSVYECDDPSHWHGTAAHSAEDRRARYRYMAANAVTRLSEFASQIGVTVELDVTEDWRYPRLGQLMFGRLFLINNGPYFHDLGVPSSTRIEPHTFNAVFYPHPTHSRIQRTAALFSEFLPVGRVFGHVLLGKDAVGTLESAVATAAMTGMAIWGDLSVISDGDKESVRRAFELSSGLRKGMSFPRTVIDGFIGSSPELHSHIDDLTGRRLTALFTHQPVVLREDENGSSLLSGAQRIKLSDAASESDGLPVRLGIDGAALVWNDTRGQMPQAADATGVGLRSG